MSKRLVAPLAVGLATALTACTPGGEVPIGTPTIVATTEAGGMGPITDLPPSLADPCNVNITRTPDGRWVSTGEVVDPVGCIALMQGDKGGKLVVVGFEPEIDPTLGPVVADTVADATEDRVNPNVEVVPATPEARQELERILGGASCVGGEVNRVSTYGAGILAIRRTMAEIYGPNTTVVAVLDKKSCNPNIGGMAFGIPFGGSEVYAGGLFTPETEAQAKRRTAIIAIEVVHELLHNLGADHAGGPGFGMPQSMFTTERSQDLGMLEGMAFEEYGGGYYDPMGTDTIPMAGDMEYLDLRTALPILNRLSLALEQTGAVEEMEVPMTPGTKLTFGKADAEALKFGMAALPQPITLTDEKRGPSTFDSIAFVPSPQWGVFTVYLVDTTGGKVQTVVLGTTDKNNEEFSIGGAHFKFGHSGSGNGGKVSVEQVVDPQTA